jgi:type II restriction enzyme
MNAAEAVAHPHHARGVVETWGEHNLYCPNCASPKLAQPASDTSDDDLACPDCRLAFQLKGQKTRLGATIADGSYETMLHTVSSDNVPGYYFMHYDVATWTVRDVLLVPGFAIPPSAVEKKKGSKSCSLVLNRIPLDARIPIVTTIKASRVGDTECIMISRMEEVRAKFRRVKPLADIPAKQRALALDILSVIRRLKKTDFTSADLQPFERELKKLHPGNRQMRDKIRQQLQVLRDMGFLAQPERGVWHLK